MLARSPFAVALLLMEVSISKIAAAQQPVPWLFWGWLPVWHFLVLIGRGGGQ